MSDQNSYGILLTPDIKIQRQYFNEMVRLLGINVIFRAPKSNKSYSTYTEIQSTYEDPIIVGCIFEEHPSQQTMKKTGWVSELQENASIIHVPYDLQGLQQGALFIVPSGLDNAKGRVFRVTKLSNIMVYPASITCEIAPEYADNYQKGQSNFKHSSFNLLAEEDDGR